MHTHTYVQTHTHIYTHIHIQTHTYFPDKINFKKPSAHPMHVLGLNSKTSKLIYETYNPLLGP